VAVAEQGHLHGPLDADGARQVKARRAVRRDADVAVGEGEEGVFRRDHQVAGGGQRDPGPGGGAANLGDYRLGHAAHREHDRMEVVNPLQEIAADLAPVMAGEILVHVLDVAAGHEVIARALEHDAAYRLVGLDLVKGIVQQAAHFHRQRVARLGPVHGQGGDASDGLYFEIGHGFSSRFGFPGTRLMIGGKGSTPGRRGRSIGAGRATTRQTRSAACSRMPWGEPARAAGQERCLAVAALVPQAPSRRGAAASRRTAITLRIKSTPMPHLQPAQSRHSARPSSIAASSAPSFSCSLTSGSRRRRWSLRSEKALPQR
jgi:hypothetical protein